MEVKASLLEPLLERAEIFGKTSFELIKLKALDKSADVSSTLISRSLLLIAFTFFIFCLNIAVALWLGDLLGKAYYGFLIVAIFYGLIGFFLFFKQPVIKARLNNFIITQLLN